MSNGFMWFDVSVADQDVEAVTEFYRTVFDGPIGPGEPDSSYRAWMMNGESPWAAVVRSDAKATAGRWVPYVQVEDLDASVAEAVDAGGSVVRPRTAGPAGDAVTLADPAGGLIALWIPFPADA